MWGWHCIDAGKSLPSHVGFDQVMPVSSHCSPNCSPAAWQVPGSGMPPPSACSGLGCGAPWGPLVFPRGGLLEKGTRVADGADLECSAACTHPRHAPQLTLSPLCSHRLRPGRSLQRGLWQSWRKPLMI